MRRPSSAPPARSRGACSRRKVSGASLADLTSIWHLHRIGDHALGVVTVRSLPDGTHRISVAIADDADLERTAQAGTRDAVTGARITAALPL
jgi:hypothetical protein